jgi:hypothetical protein
MGVITLSEFRDRMSTTLGDRNLAASRLTEAVNDAYYEIAGGVQFEEFEKVDSQSTSNGVRNYALPSDDIASVLFVVRTSDYLNLRWVEKAEFLRLDPGSGAPTRWTRIGAEIFLSPIPDASYGFDIHYRTMPVRLTLDSDVTAISALWDQPIYLLAVHYMWLALGEEDRAMVWYQRVLNSLQTRMSEEDFARMTLGKIPSRFNTTPETEE